MFDLRVYRHRWFETPFLLMQPHHPRHKTPAVGSHGRDRKRLYQEEGWFATIVGNVGSYCGDAMGIDWMTGDELSQAIPPAYCHFIGLQLLGWMRNEEEWYREAKEMTMPDHDMAV